MGLSCHHEGQSSSTFTSLLPPPSYLSHPIMCIELTDNSRTASAVKETVTGLDGVVDSVGASSVVDLPETEANNWHVMAAVELDRRRSHDCCGQNTSRRSFKTIVVLSPARVAEKLRQGKDGALRRGVI